MDDLRSRPYQSLDVGRCRPAAAEPDRPRPLGTLAPLLCDCQSLHHEKRSRGAAEFHEVGLQRVCREARSGLGFSRCRHQDPWPSMVANDRVAFPCVRAGRPGAVLPPQAGNPRSPQVLRHGICLARLRDFRHHPPLRLFNRERSAFQRIVGNARANFAQLRRTAQPIQKPGFRAQLQPETLRSQGHGQIDREMDVGTL